MGNTLIDNTFADTLAPGHIKLTNQQNGEPIFVKCYGPIDLLAIHKSVNGDKGYTLTHVRSGLRLFDCRTIAEAKAARTELLKVDGWQTSNVLTSPHRIALRDATHTARRQFGIL